MTCYKLWYSSDVHRYSPPRKSSGWIWLPLFCSVDTASSHLHTSSTVHLTAWEVYRSQQKRTKLCHHRIQVSLERVELTDSLLEDWVVRTSAADAFSLSTVPAKESREVKHNLTVTAYGILTLLQFLALRGTVLNPPQLHCLVIGARCQVATIQWKTNTRHISTGKTKMSPDLGILLIPKIEILLYFALQVC